MCYYYHFHDLCCTSICFYLFRLLSFSPGFFLDFLFCDCFFIRRTVASAPRELLARPSNRQLLSNAITHVCLAGATMSVARSTVLSELQQSPGEHFLLLLKQERVLIFKALYLCNLDTQQAMKLYGDGPDLMDSTQIQLYFKYDSAAKQFKPIPAEVNNTHNTQQGRDDAHRSMRTHILIYLCVIILFFVCLFSV